MMGIDLSETLDISKKLDNIYSSLVEKSYGTICTLLFLALACRLRC